MGNWNPPPHHLLVSPHYRINAAVAIIVAILGWQKTFVTSTRFIFLNAWAINFLYCVTEVFWKIHVFRFLLSCSSRSLSTCMGCRYYDTPSSTTFPSILCHTIVSPHFSLTYTLPWLSMIQTPIEKFALLLVFV